MRHAAFIIALALAACLLVVPALATPPSDVTVKYDKTTDQLSVTITHATLDPTTHYVKRVIVNINGKVVSDNEYQSQPTKDVFTYSLPVNAGDTVRVTAVCSIAGSTDGVLTLPTPSSTAPPTIAPTNAAPVPTTQKSPAGLMPVLGAGFLAVLALSRNRK